VVLAQEIEDFLRLGGFGERGVAAKIAKRIGSAFTSLCDTVLRVEIERATGAPRIAQAYSVFECGQALTPQVVLGQAQGGFAMGVGHALLESLPP
jgi:CO/xanthine dehydrogenase Mo-binding subunit